MKRWTLHSNLLLAIQDNDLAEADAILTNYRQLIDPDVKFNLGYGSITPAICLCVERGLYQMVKLFLSHGCSVNATDENGYSALHFSASHQFVDILKLLLKNRADVNSVSHYGQSPLHLACQQSSVEVVQTLIQFGADTNKKDSDSRTPLSLACLYSQTAIAEYLLSTGKVEVNNLDNLGNSPLHHAINAGLSINVRLVKALLGKGADPNLVNHLGNSPLSTVVRRASETNLEGIETVNELIRHGCDINGHNNGVDDQLGETPLHLSISRGQDKITEALIRAGADVNQRNWRDCSPLHRVAREDKVDLVALMMAAGADVTTPKTFYVNEGGAIQDIAHPEIRSMFASWRGRKVAPLKHLIRVGLRRYLERRADSVIRSLNLPPTLQDYLMLLDL